MLCMLKLMLNIKKSYWFFLHLYILISYSDRTKHVSTNNEILLISCLC